MKCLTYLGNKRKQLDQILGEFKKYAQEGLVLDLFSGSGVVAHHLKSNGYTVHANDIAPYSYPINRISLEFSAESLSCAYPELDKQLAFLNGLTEPPAEAVYFSKHYSENPATKYQRLYYTARNGKFIDAVLHEIHKPGGVMGQDIKDVVLADLLYKMSKHVNTSGHFKTFHKEFGGLKKKHDLARIISPIEIERPEPPAGPIGKAFCMDATALINDLPHDYAVIYLDPPYNQHQYSANYHLLEYACYPKELRYIPKDSQVSGIDPNLYKSPYCSKRQLAPALKEVIDGCCDKTDVILISFHERGFIDLEKMTALVNMFGNVEVAKTNAPNEYLITLRL